MDDLDAALNGIASGDAAAPSPPGETARPALLDADPTPTTPGGRPPSLDAAVTRRRRSTILPAPTPSTYTSRAVFDDLFVADISPAPPGRGTPEEKVEYFREKLKRAESQSVRFKDAWQTRERELDVLEAMLKTAADRSSDFEARAGEANQKLSHYERFLETKREEFENYGRKLSQVLAERETQIGTLQKQFDDTEQARRSAVAAHERDNEAHEAKARASAAQLSQERDALEQLQRETDAARASATGRINELETQRTDLMHELEMARTDIEEGRKATERDLAVRAEAHDKLRASLEKQREAVTERDQQIESLNARLAEQATVAQDLTHDLAGRDENIEKLRGAIQNQRETMGKRDAQIEAISIQMQDMQTAHQQAVSGMQDTVAAHREEIEELKHAVVERNEAIDKLKSTVEQLRGRSAELQDELRRGASQLEAAHSESDGERVRTHDLVMRTRKALEVAQRILGAGE